MGVVYLAENVRIRRRVAIKVLHATYARMREAVTRFEREAQAAACIGSPHITEVIDMGATATGERYVIMEYLEGENLLDRLHTQRVLPPKQAVDIALQVLAGLVDVHAAGIVHRDLKPGNLFLEKRRSGDFVRILDFGISKFRAGIFGEGGDDLSAKASPIGTPAYMAPEHCGGLSVDARADVYSLGAILYRCLSGHRPFVAPTPAEVLVKVISEEPRPLERIAPGVDRDLAAIVKKAMARHRQDRYQTAAELLAALEGWQAGERRPELEADVDRDGPTISREAPHEADLEAPTVSRRSPAAAAPAGKKPPRPSPRKPTADAAESTNPPTLEREAPVAARTEGPPTPDVITLGSSDLSEDASSEVPIVVSPEAPSGDDTPFTPNPFDEEPPAIDPQRMTRKGTLRMSDPFLAIPGSTPRGTRASPPPLAVRANPQMVSVALVCGAVVFLLASFVGILVVILSR
jgi:serine/threonine-protein kinase